MIGPDALCRAFCGTIGTPHLKELHVSLCHPGVTRMAHFVRSKNRPYSLSDIRQMTSECRECQEIKSQFVQSQGSCLIKSTLPFERLNLDFKGPLPSTTKKRYFPTSIDDEYTGFPFAFPCSDMRPLTVIDCLTQLFSIFGTCAFIHSDRWSSFQFYELKSWLLPHGVATSQTISYIIQGVTANAKSIMT